MKEFENLKRQLEMKEVENLKRQLEMKEVENENLKRQIKELQQKMNDSIIIISREYELFKKSFKELMNV